MARPLPARERVILEANAVDAYRAGEPVAHIARRLRLGRATIYRWVRAAAIVRADAPRLTRCEHCGGPMREPR